MISEELSGELQGDTLPERKRNERCGSGIGFRHDAGFLVTFDDRVHMVLFLGWSA
jgi:hypothetical protein